LTELKFIGRCDTGKIFEQDVEIVNSDGQKLQIRRIVVELAACRTTPPNHATITT
jgi:hypothetical protein